MRKAVAAAALAVGLCGCVAVWGRGYHIEAESPQSVTLKYDSHFASLDEVRDVARQRCNQFGEGAVPQANTSTSLGITTIVFDCVPRP